MAIEFLEYENELATNLERLARELTKKRPTWFATLQFIGGFSYIPKGLRLPSKPSTLHFSSSNSDDAFKNAIADGIPQAQFRPIALFTVDMHVICALWINEVGHKFDACLPKEAMGSRLRRIRNASDGPTSTAYHRNAPGSFQNYFPCYRSWRRNGLTAIRRELASRQKVVAITMDLTSFYHNVDPRFILDSGFQKACGFVENNGPLTDDEELFTTQLIHAFETWARQLPTHDPGSPIGIPVGPTASKVFANVLLAEFDRLILEELSPVYYGRYVDDIFLVIRDHGNLDSANKVLDFLVKRIPQLRHDQENAQLELKLSYSASSKLIFKREKQKIFHLSGEVGEDLIDTIESRIDEVSSEWRLLPDLHDLERSPAARVLTAGQKSNDEVDSLRKADSLSIRRLGFSLMLRSCVALARDLPPQEWQNQRYKFYRFAIEHVLAPLQILDLHGYLPQLISLAISSEDWSQAVKLVRKIKRVIDRLEKNTVVIDGTNAGEQWAGFRNHLAMSLWEAVLKAVPLNLDTEVAAKHLEGVKQAIREVHSLEHLDMQGIGTSRQLFHCDLGRLPFKDWLLELVEVRSDENVVAAPDYVANEYLPAAETNRKNELKSLLQSMAKPDIPLRPLLFPTRPLNASEVTAWHPQCATDTKLWGDIVKLLRGTWFKLPPVDDNRNSSSEIIVGGRNRSTPPRVAVTSFLVENHSWIAAAGGVPDLTRERYTRLVRLANAIVRAKHKPDYVVFPELSIPRRWIAGLAHHFLRAKISLIAGVEYRFLDKVPTLVANEAKLFLTDDRLGYPTWCCLTHRKRLPAPHERDDLRSKFGLSFSRTPPSHSKVYNHFGFCIGVMICSELTDIKKRMEMRGNVDGLFVLSWNQDLESFASLVESCSLDVHCFTIMANNRKYGDSRIRAPYKDTWRRDLVRVKGGLDDYFVVTELEVSQLRTFQSNVESPNEPFKPTPEGFVISKARKQLPK